MALIACTECGKSISDKAFACPQCGAPTGRGGHPMAAIGDVAMGVFALGGAAYGGVVLGGFSLGLVSIGGAAIGVLLGLGGLATGYVAFGGLAIGYYALGGLAFGAHALGSNFQDPEAIEFFRRYLGSVVDEVQRGR